MLTLSETAHGPAEPISRGLPSAGQNKYWRSNLSKALSDKDVVIKQIIESKWFGLKSDFKDVDVKYEDVMMTMDDWQAIPLIRGLTDLWLTRETNAIATCVAALVLKE